MVPSDVLGLLLLLVLVAAIGFLALPRSMGKPRKVATVDMWTVGRVPDVAPDVATANDPIPVVLQTRFDPSAAPSLQAVLQFHFTDQTPADWHVNVAPGTCSAETGVALNPTTTITTSAGPWREILSGKTGVAAAFMAGKFQAEGDLGLIMRLDALFPAPSPEVRAADAAAGTVDVGAFPNPRSRPPTAPASSEHATSRHVKIETTSPDGTPAVFEYNISGSLPDAVRDKIEREIRGLPTDLSPDEREEAMLKVLQDLAETTGQPREVRTRSFESVRMKHRAGGKVSVEQAMSEAQNLEAAVERALTALPPNASDDEREAAIRAALGKVSGDWSIEVHAESRGGRDKEP